jgi:hypothetical protein
MITDREKFAGNPTNGEAQLPIRKAFMTRDDIFRIAVQAGARPSLSPELWDFWNIRNADLERFAALVAAHEREKVAKWMVERSYATGHGDTIEDLLREIDWQAAEREREGCASVAESYEPTCDTCPSGVANAIRARGKK